MSVAPIVYLTGVPVGDPTPQITLPNTSKLWLIRALHTLVWAFFVAAILLALFSGVTDTITVYTWVAGGLVVVEGLTLLLFKGQCPLTVVARNYSQATRHNFDIFLPEWLAHYNKLIFMVIYLVALLLVAYRLLV